MQQRIEEIAKKTQGCSIDNQRILMFFQQFRKQQKHYNDFEYLGNGSFALVIKAFNKTSQKHVALKIVLCNQNEPNDAESVLKEYNLLLKIKNCPYLVDVYNQFYVYEEKILIDDSDDEEQIGEKPKKQNEILKSFLVLELEFCNTNLADYFIYCRDKKQYPDKKMKEILTIQILDGISFLHQKQFLHRDIKPNNILLKFDNQNNPIIKICDLAFASFISPSQSKIHTKQKGTKEYMPPESESDIWRKESDLFQVGIVLLELDNIEKFDFLKTTENERYALRNGQIFPTQSLDRKSNIFEIAQTFLNPNFKARQSAQMFLEQLIWKDQQYQNIELSSIIIMPQLGKKVHEILNSNAQQEQDLNLSQNIQESMMKSQIMHKVSQINQQSKNQISQVQNSVQAMSQSQIYQDQIQILLNDYQNLKIQRIFTEEELKKAMLQLFNNKNYSKSFYLINQGGKGVIIGGYNLKDKRDCVLKIQKVQSKSRIIKETGILKSCQMDLIIKLYDSFYLNVIQKEDFIVYELEKCSCDLKSYLEKMQNDQQFTQKIKEEIAIQMIDSVNYIHQHNIIHRDIKLQNFLVQESNSSIPIIKLSDFDEADYLGSDYVIDLDHFYFTGEFIIKFFKEPNCDGCGTFGFWAPEQIYQKESTKESDVFSLGISLSLLDNFQKLQPVYHLECLKFGKEFVEPFQPYKGELDIINRLTQIYQKAIMHSLVYDKHKRKNLSQILDGFRQNYFSKEINKISLINDHKIAQINFKEKQIDAEGAKHIGMNLEKCKNITSLNLNLAGNGFGAEGAKHIGMSLERCQNITSLNLDLQGNEIGVEGVKHFGMSLEKCQNINSLNLNLTGNEIGAQGAKNIGMSLEKCKNITSLNLNLVGNEIGAEGAKHIGMSLERCLNITSLNLDLGQNKIGAEGAKYIGMSLEKCQNITYLNLSILENNIGAEGGKYIGMSLEKCQNITSLNLNLVKNNIGAEGAKHIEMCLEKCQNITFLSLNLGISNIGAVGAKHIGMSLEKCQNITSLNLNLLGNEIGAEGAKHIGMSLEKCKNITSLNLNLTKNKIGAEGAKHIGMSLEKCQNIISLNFNLGINNIGIEGAKYIGMSLEKCLNITSLNLNLTGNEIGAVGIKHIGMSLEKCQNITSLNIDLVENNIDAEGAKHFGMSLEKCKNITSLNLNLSCNIIGVEGAKHIGMSLQKCQNITSLNLSLIKSNIGAEGAKHIGVSLENYQNITSLSLNLWLNNIGIEGAKYIGMSLEKCQNITSLKLNLVENNIGAEGAKHIGMSLEKCQNITSLNINLAGNEIGAEGAKHIGMSLEKCQNLNSLILIIWTKFDQKFLSEYVLNI